RGERPSNIFIYGKTGTGKTISVKKTVDELNNVAESQNMSLEVMYLNCKLKKIADTEYRLIAQMAREMGKAIPATGLPTEEVYKIFYNELDKKNKLFIIILDEIDQVVKKMGDELLYNLTRMNSELDKSQICLVGISNDTQFTSYLDSRVKSSLSEEEILFPPYDALQLQDILKKRSIKAFEKEVVEPGVIEKCAAYAARDHGDARRALDLLRVSGELCERNGDSKISLKYLDEAENKIERDKIYDLVETQPKQHQLTLFAILTVSSSKTERIFTGEVYEVYKELCEKTGLRPLTQRRISDIIGEFDMLGIIYARVISQGRYGRTREIVLSIPKSTRPKIIKMLEEKLNLG
ncbi:orc1/cdc6 family replication initiation protein, partial [Candidatus Woesearchaeota archaeon]|nr:orc1/cdc6 family replication initiation protein [Candidatus Woesearchaeota archaeon]